MTVNGSSWFLIDGFNWLLVDGSSWGGSIVLVITWNDVVVWVTIVGHQVALLTVALKLSLIRVDLVDRHQVVHSIHLNSDLVLVLLSGCDLLSGRQAVLMWCNVLLIIVVGAVVLEEVEVITCVSIVWDECAAIVVTGELDQVRVNLVERDYVGLAINLDDSLVRGDGGGSKLGFDVWVGRLDVSTCKVELVTMG